MDNQAQFKWEFVAILAILLAVLGLFCAGLVAIVKEFATP